MGLFACGNWKRLLLYGYHMGSIVFAYTPCLKKKRSKLFLS